jgi:HPt (histidine-containing phosphotransfer) domain-containing protein
MMDPLAPNRDAFWSAITDRLAAIDQGLTWMDLAQARQALHDLGSSLRMLGLADLADLAERLWQGFQADPRHPDRLTELAALQAAVSAAKAAGGAIPIAEASLRRCLLVVSDDPAIAGLAKDLNGWRRIVARDTVSAAVWLRRGDIHAVLLDNALTEAEAWLGAVPEDLPVILTAPLASGDRGVAMPERSHSALQALLALIP